MKKIVSFWNRRSSFEKVVFGLFAAFVVCCLGYFSSKLYYGSQCVLCKRTLWIGKHYILDVRTGELLDLDNYVDRESSVFWLTGIGHAPQETSLPARIGYMRFPLQAPATARYCANHTVNLDSDFYVLSPVKGAMVYYAIRDGQNYDPEGRIMTKRFNETFGCWELAIQWDPPAPPSSS